MTTMAYQTCRCGLEVELHRGRHQDGPYWDVWDPEDMPDKLPPGEVVADEVLRERAAAERFGPVIACRCGRRYRATLDPPTVVRDSRWQRLVARVRRPPASDPPDQNSEQW